MPNEPSEMYGQDGFRFHGQRSDEHVMALYRQHWLILARAVLIALVSLVIPYFVGSWLHGLWAIGGELVYGLALGLFLWSRLYSFFNTVYILSDQRILSVLQLGFFTRQINEAELNRIQDVSSENKGAWETVFGFGRVIIRTASKESFFVLKNVPDPYDAQQAIVRSLKDINQTRA